VNAGVLAFGDSITNGGGELQWGVALQSWALWVARGLALPFTTYAVDGARTADVARRQVPAFEAQSPFHYHLGCLYSGVNDVRAYDWDADAFAADYGAVVDVLRARCERVLVVTLPLDLGRPRAGAKVEEANARIEAQDGVLVLDLRDFGARNLVMTDRVHPTAFGQVAIAERALDVLAADGMDVRVRPSTLISPAERSPLRALQGDWTYIYRALKVSLRAAAAARRAARAGAARSGS
jgi:lysophospholipase L1-like esterase